MYIYTYMYDHAWLCMIMYDYVLLCMIMYYHVLLCIIMYYVCIIMYVCTHPVDIIDYGIFKDLAIFVCFFSHFHVLSTSGWLYT